jgi:hypothetical protein
MVGTIDIGSARNEKLTGHLVYASPTSFAPSRDLSGPTEWRILRALE